MKEEIGKNKDHKLPMTKVNPGRTFNTLIQKCLNRDPSARSNFPQIVAMLKSLKIEWNRSHNSKV